MMKDAHDMMVRNCMSFFFFNNQSFILPFALHLERAHALVSPLVAMSISRKMSLSVIASDVEAKDANAG